ncbi:MAG: hypothetical protein C0597_16845 [Marinilabiliales bacterium]|nr:MAG: hypothetical protein C0597_16845 [Marinilabiliales bacterium]
MILVGRQLFDLLSSFSNNHIKALKLLKYYMPFIGCRINITELLSFHKKESRIGKQRAVIFVCSE